MKHVSNLTVDAAGAVRRRAGEGKMDVQVLSEGEVVCVEQYFGTESKMPLEGINIGEIYKFLRKQDEKGKYFTILRETADGVLVRMGSCSSGEFKRRFKIVGEQSVSQNEQKEENNP